MSRPSPDTLVILESLRKSVANALEKKRRLGQYAVVWENGRSVILRGSNLNVEDDSAGPPVSFQEQAPRD